MTNKEQILSIVNQLNKENAYKSLDIDTLLDAQMKLYKSFIINIESKAEPI